MKTNHTPGPWILEAGRSFKTSDGEFYLSYGADKRTGTPNFQDFCALDANARLIAAAPDLLATLEAILARGHLRSNSGLWRDIRAAIAKAKGE